MRYVLLAVFPLVCIAFACDKAQDVSLDFIVVTVNDHVIREADVIAEADRRIDAAAAKAATTGLIYEEKSRHLTRRGMRDDVLHTLVERCLIMDQLSADGITISDADVSQAFADRARKRNQTLNEACQEITEQGKTLEDVRTRLKYHTIAIERFYERHATSKKVLSEAEARRMYDENPAQFALEEERRVSRILIAASIDFPSDVRQAARKRAEELRQRLINGADFAAATRELSDDRLTKTRGGDRGWSTRGFVTAPGNDPFGDAAFALQRVGDISSVVETVDGYDIILLTGIKPAHQRSFEEAREFIVDRDRYYEINNFWETYAQQLRNAATIVYAPSERERIRLAKAKAEALAASAEAASH